MSNEACRLFHVRLRAAALNWTPLIYLQRSPQYLTQLRWQLIDLLVDL